MKIIIPKNLKFLCEISSLKLDEKVQHEVRALYQNLKSIIGPAPKLHDTGLLVKGEVFNIHLKIAIILVNFCQALAPRN